MSCMEDVQALAKSVIERQDKLDVLINNAGVYSSPELVTQDIAGMLAGTTASVQRRKGPVAEQCPQTVNRFQKLSQSSHSGEKRITLCRAR